MNSPLTVALLSRNREALDSVFRIKTLLQAKNERLKFLKKQYDDAVYAADREMEKEFKVLFDACRDNMPADAMFENYAIGFNIEENWVNIARKDPTQPNIVVET